MSFSLFLVYKTIWLIYDVISGRPLTDVKDFVKFMELFEKSAEVFSLEFSSDTPRSSRENLPT